MIIKTIKLLNFQKHSNLELNFSDGVNILHGASDCGKSCIRRAIEWCLFSENISGIRREGSKQTSVLIEFDNEIELERIKSASINRYILRKDGEEKVYDAIGRSMPEEIVDIINIKPTIIDDQEINLNISRQLDPPFLLGKTYSGSFRMKLFNKLTGNDLLDKVLKSFSKDLRQINIDEKNYTEQLEEDRTKFETVEKEYEAKQKIYDIINHKFQKIKKKQEQLDKLNTLLQNITELRRAILDVDTELDNIQDIDINKVEELKSKIHRFSKLKELYIHRIFTIEEKEDISFQLSKIVAPTLNIEEMRGKIKRLDILKTLHRDIRTINLDKKSETLELEEVTISLQISIQEYKDILTKSGKCPSCKKSLSKQEIEEIKL